MDGAVGPELGVFDMLVRTITGGRGGRTGAVKCGISFSSLIDCGRISGITTISVASIS